MPDAPRLPERLTLTARSAASGAASRRVYFGPKARWLDTPVITRADLAAARPGPCIVEEYDATAVVPPNAEAGLDRWGNIVMTLAPATPRRARARKTAAVA